MEDEYTEIVLEELNVKQMEYTNDVSGFIDYIIKPQMRTARPEIRKATQRYKSSAFHEYDGS